jgi:hypothetical protein
MNPLPATCLQRWRSSSGSATRRADFENGALAIDAEVRGGAVETILVFDHTGKRFIRIFQLKAVQNCRNWGQ